LKIYSSHDGVATQLRCGGIFNNRVVANCQQSVPVKEFLKSVTIFAKDMDINLVAHF